MHGLRPLMWRSGPRVPSTSLTGMTNERHTLIRTLIGTVRTAASIGFVQLTASRSLCWISTPFQAHSWLNSWLIETIGTPGVQREFLRNGETTGHTPSSENSSFNATQLQPSMVSRPPGKSATWTETRTYRSRPSGRCTPVAGLTRPMPNHCYSTPTKPSACGRYVF